MKKAKILLLLISASLLLTYFKIILYLGGMDTLDKAISTIDSTNVLEILGFIIYLLAILFFTMAYFLIGQSIWLFIQKGFFSETINKKLQKGGILFIAYGLIKLLFGLYLIVNYNELFDTQRTIQYLQIIENGYILIIGLVLLIVSDIIRKGIILKKENDLTI